MDDPWISKDIHGYPWNLWVQFGVTLVSLWGYFGINLVSLWGYFGIHLVSLWYHFGLLLGRSGVSSGSLGNIFGVSFVLDNAWMIHG